jgi:hypothetical protein
MRGGAASASTWCWSQTNPWVNLINEVVSIEIRK